MAFKSAHATAARSSSGSLANRLAGGVRGTSSTSGSGPNSGPGAPAEDLGNEALIAESYRGIRPAPDIPCLDHTEKRAIWELLDVRAETGIELTESDGDVAGSVGQQALPPTKAQ